MDENTLLPVRIKSRGSYSIGNEGKALTSDSGFTRAIVYATAESILKSKAIQAHDVKVVANALGSEYLNFDSYEEEVNSRFGRPVLQIIQDDGEEAYSDLKGHINPNPYLHAAIHTTTVWEAAQELNASPNLVIRTGNGWEKFKTKFQAPDAVSVAIIGDDGEIYETDLREFTPTLEWVGKYWTQTGGNRKHTYILSDDDGKREILDELSVDEADGEVLLTYVRRADRSITLHYIRDREESIAEGESDRLVMFCGSDVKATSDLPKLSIDTGRIDSKHKCGNCAPHAE